MLKKFRLFPEEFHLFPLVWLIYLIFPIGQLVFEEDVAKKIIGFVLLLFFLVVYRDSYWNFKRRTLHITLILAIVWSFCILYHPMMWYMGFYATNLIGLLRSLRKQLVMTGVLVFSFLSIILIDHIEIYSNTFINILIPLIIMVFMPFGIRASNKFQEMRQKLQSANQQIEELIIKEERQRIARDLHDTLGHTLSLITLKSELVEKLMKKDMESATIEIKEIQHISRSTLKQVRELVSDMKMTSLSEEIALAKSILEAANIQFVLTPPMSDLSIEKLNENILGMCVKELVTNVVKHSKATVCELKVENQVGEISVYIKDNGLGFNPDSMEGNGLTGIRERLQLIDGSLTINSKEERGTIMKVKIPKVIRKNEVTA